MVKTITKRWDLYLLNLYSGELEQITDTPEFDGAPSWSPDGRWLAYESYREDTGSLEIFVRPLDGAQEPIQLTDDPGADFDPAWSPLGRQIAFVSTRSGENEIWLADLDLADNRFRNASRNNHQTESHPTWSPDGSQLVWSTVGASGIHELSMVSTTSLSDPHPNPRMVGSGSWAAWSPTHSVTVSWKPHSGMNRGGAVGNTTYPTRASPIATMNMLRTK